MDPLVVADVETGRAHHVVLWRWVAPMSFTPTARHRPQEVDHGSCPEGPVGMALHNANRHHTIDGPTITVSPMRATFTDSRPSCREAVLAAMERLELRTGVAEPARRDIVAEVQAADAGFERQTIYRCLRRLTGSEVGSAYRDVEDLGSNRLRVW